MKWLTSLKKMIEYIEVYIIYERQEYEVALLSVTEMFDTSTPQGMLFL